MVPEAVAETRLCLISCLPAGPNPGTLVPQNRAWEPTHVEIIPDSLSRAQGSQGQNFHLRLSSRPKSALASSDVLTGKENKNHWSFSKF